ncbi:carbohydrate kinase family protein [Jiella marina]|uniref:carbohydrate kinase family protein n=1 Tax=Jiella sp. LLJ827 TaxID=2917712 RepID=UPI00210149AB|nr:carbohydrate kinase family protein [Jiella sp. LLJ827]MCQ0986319.1 carbohydrate kinase family protein [Jiella sp. LLJ827]
MPAERQSPRLVCYGNLTIDDVVLPDGSERPGCIGGDALYATLAARALLPKTEMIAPVGNDLPEETTRRMEAGGLSPRDLPARDLPTLHNRVEYRADGSRQWTLFASETDFERLSPVPRDVPEAYLAADAHMILAMALSAQEELVAYLRRETRAVVALDPQEDYIAGNEDRLRRMIASLDIFMPSEEEIVRLFRTRDVRKAARDITSLGPWLAVIKLGAEGCFVYDRRSETEFALPAWPGAKVIDTTGAGDSFCGGFMASLVRDPDAVEAAARTGAVTASIAVEGYGADRLLEASADDFRTRLDGWRDERGKG